MTHAQLIFACVLQIVEGGSVGDARCSDPLVQSVVVAIERESVQYDVPSGIVAAVIYHESHYDQHALGSKGEIGLMQVKRGGAVESRMKLSTHALAQVHINVHLGVAYLGQFVHKCSVPSQWLTLYNRGPGRCRASTYSQGVLKDLRMGRRTRLLYSQADLDDSRSGYRSTSTWESPTEWKPSRTSYTGPEIPNTTPQGTREPLPAGTGPRPTPMGSTLEEVRKVEEVLSEPFEDR